MSDEQMRETVRRARELRAFVSPDPDHWDDHNAEIAAALCNQELPALCDDNDRLRAELAKMTRERDAYRRAKQENDERFMRERDDARAERDALRAIVDGRTTATSAEFDGIEAAGYKLVAAFDDAGEPVRWWVIRDGLLCAWPVVKP